MCSISDLTRSHVERWEGILRLERKNKGTSVQTKIKSIRTFLYWCMDEERGWLKPFSITLPRADMTLKEPYTKEELTALLAPPANEDLSEWRNWAAVGFISRTGGEAIFRCQPEMDRHRFRKAHLPSEAYQDK